MTVKCIAVKGGKPSNIAACVINCFFHTRIVELKCCNIFPALGEGWKFEFPNYEHDVTISKTKG